MTPDAKRLLAELMKLDTAELQRVIGSASYLLQLRARDAARDAARVAPPENSHNSTPSEPSETIGRHRASLPTGGRLDSR
jgi:hypothetical protein